MSEYIVNEAALTATADKIREKGGTTDQIVWDENNGFGNAVEAIQAGGGVEEPYVKETYNSNGEIISAQMVGQTVVRNYEFYYCDKLANIDIPATVTSIGPNAFYSCSNLTLTSLPAGITTISASAFQNCYNLTLTSLSAGLLNIYGSAFYGCSNLALTSLPAGLEQIGSSAFRNCSKLTITSLPANLNSIGSNAFSGCTGITSITFQKKPITTLYSTTFANCTNLTTINVPWAQGEVSGAPWGATNATINYNYTS